MNTYSTDRAVFAANALVCLAIAFGTLSFWSDAIAAGDPVSAPVDWLVAGLLTVAMLATSLILSGAVLRFAEARTDHKATAAFVVVLGAVLCLIEAGMTHEGLAWLDARKDIAPDWMLVTASFGLSLFNVFALYTFGRELKKKAPALTVVESPASIAGRDLAFHRHGKTN